MQYTPVTPKLIEELAQSRFEGACISAYFPVDRPPADVRRNPVRIKNLLREVKEALDERETADEQQPVFDRIAERDRDGCDWSQEFHGIGVFANAGELRLVHLPHKPDEIVLASDRYYLKPLFVALSLTQSFLVLMLSQNEVRLARGDSSGLAPVEDSDWLPSSLMDVTGRQLSEPQLQYHSAARGAGGDGAIFHGQGSGKDDTEAETERFLRAIDEALCTHCRDETCIVLAGVDKLTNTFRRLSNYPSLLPEAIPGNPADMSLQQLYTAASERFRAYQDLQRERALRRAQDKAPERLLSQVEAVVKAAADGRIDELFVASDEECWGRYTPAERRVSLHEVRRPGDEGLLDRAAVDSFIRGARVRPVPAALLPESSVALALLRY
jgi:hypothetical protein